MSDATRIFRLTTGGAPVTPQARGFSAERGVATAANDSVYGLAVEIWTRDISKAHRTAWQLKASHAVGRVQAIGLDRELGASGIDLYTRPKASTSL